MINAAIYTETIGAGLTSRRLFSGSQFKIISATGALNVRTDVVRLDALVSGQGFQSAPFDYLELTDASGASNTIRYVVATEGFIDGITGSMQITATVPVQSVGFANAQKTVTNASAQLIASNTARKYLLIQNKDASGSIWIVFGAVGATQALGVKIGPGANYELPGTVSTQEIRAIGDIASNANIVVVEG